MNSKMSDEIKILLSYLEIAPNRFKIFKLFKEYETITQARILAECDFKSTNITRYVKQLQEKDLIYTVDPTVRKGKQYKLTTKGKHLIQYLE